MTAAAIVPARFDMGRVASRTFGVVGRNLFVFGLLAFLLAGIPEGITRFLSQMAVFGGGFRAGLFSVCTGLISYIALNVLQASIIHGTVADLNGRKADFGDCFSTGIRFLWPVVGVSLLTGLAVGFGALLLIVPGVLMALAWCVNVPAIVVERKGVTESFGRSAELTRGHRGAIFLLALGYVLAVWVLDLVGMAISGGLSFTALASGTFNPVQWVVLTALQVVQSLVGAAGIAAIYYELRSTKEGIGPEALAAVFD